MSYSLLFAVLASVFLSASCAPNRPEMLASRHGVVFLPDVIDDPLEPMNRGIWAFNSQLLRGVVAPASRGYKAVVPNRARKSIRNFGYNIIYPGRVVNQLLQGRWGDAGQDTLRFLTNTTVGVAGLFDVATEWEIDRPSGKFANTFQKWGWRPESFVMLPALGPSDEVHVVGLGGDTMSNPLRYSQTGRKIAYGVTFNGLSEDAEDAAMRVSADPDSYSTLKYIWSYTSRYDDPDWSVKGAPHMPTLETMNVMNIQLKDPKFVYKGKSSKVRIDSTKEKLPFDYWLQDEKSPLVYIAPGLGSHRKTVQILAVAESLYNKGFSVVTISGVFHPEFVENGLSHPVPGYAHKDSHDLLAAFTAIDEKLSKKYKGRFGKRGLLGFSMGGYQTLTLAAHRDEQAKGSLSFDKYVAVSPPVDLMHGLNQLDSYQKAPLEWSEDQRQQRINNTIHKIAAMTSRPEAQKGAPPFSEVESKYIMGLVFRFTLRNTIYASQKKQDMGVLSSPISKWNRQQVYHEILGISFRDYFEKFVVPYYLSEGVDASDIERFNNLSQCSGVLSRDPASSVVAAQNDFLLSPADIQWLKTTFGSKRLTLLPNGGHMGFLGDDGAHAVITGYLEELKD